MLVPQWAGRIPMGRKVDLGLGAMSLRRGHDTDTS